MNHSAAISKEVKQNHHFKAAEQVSELLKTAGFEAYVIGGAVRDMILGIIPKDFDLVTNAKPEQILDEKNFKSARFKDTAQAYGVSRVTVDVKMSSGVYPVEIEIATYRRDIEAHLGRKLTQVEFTDLKDDVRRRDFTINALALNIVSGDIIDYVGGLEDIKNRKIRFIGEPTRRIQEDPLRILRAIRLKNQLGFTFDAKTEKALKKSVAEDQINVIAIKRVQDELSRMLTHVSRRSSLEDLDKFGILKLILPEVYKTKNVLQPPSLHYEGDVWMHTLLALDALPSDASNRLAWATLLHDVGKPPTQTMPDNESDRIRFNEHYTKGAAITRQILARLQFSKKETEEIAWMVHHHLSVDTLPKMRPGRRHHMFAEPAFADLLKLHTADAKATWHLNSHGKVVKPEPQFKTIKKLYSEFNKKKQHPPPNLKKDLSIDGNWVKSELNINDSPTLGKILELLNNSYLDGEIKNIKDAKEMILKLKAKYNL